MNKVFTNADQAVSDLPDDASIMVGGFGLSGIRSPQSPYLDSNFYTTVSMVHTIETLLGLPPMNNNYA